MISEREIKLLNAALRYISGDWYSYDLPSLADELLECRKRGWESETDFTRRLDSKAQSIISTLIIRALDNTARHTIDLTEPDCNYNTDE